MSKFIHTLFLYLWIATFCYPQTLSAQSDANSLLQKAALESLVKKNYEEAADLYKQAATLLKKSNNERKYLEAIKGLGECYERANKPDSALKYYGILIKDGDYWQNDIAFLRSARIFKEKGNVTAAIQAYENGVTLYHQNERSLDETFYRIFYELFYLSNNSGKPDKAISIGKELVNLLEGDFSRRVIIQSDLGLIYEEVKRDLTNAKLVFQDLIDCSRQYGNLSVNSRQAVALAVAHLASISYELNNLSEALDYAVSALDLLPEPNGKDISVRFILLKLLSICHAKWGNTDLSISYAKEAYDLSCDNETLANIREVGLVNLYTIYIMFGKPELAAALLARNDMKFTSLSAASLYSTLSASAYESGDYRKAVEWGELSVASWKENPDFFNNLAVYYSALKEYEKAAENIKHAWHISVSSLENLFLDSREEERALVWDKYKEIIKTPLQLIWQTDEKEIMKYAYNSILLTKGIRLNCYKRLREAVLRSNDEKLKDLYFSWQSLPISSDEKKTAELRLLAELKNNRQIDTGFSTRWEDVRNSLNEDDVAIEFFRIHRSDTDKDAYLALLLRKTWDAPRSVFISLEDLKDMLDFKNISGIYSSEEFGKYIWDQILVVAQADTDRLRNIYFAPDGILHNIAIENLMYNGSRLSDLYNLHRLSSTRDLVWRDKTSNYHNIALYGGIDYDISVEELVYYANNFCRGSKDDFIWNYLPGTKSEIENIKTILSKKKYDIVSYSGEECVEATLKQYDGKPIDILHIATHGFYIPSGRYADPLDKDIKSLNEEEESLMRCGLAFSGANNTPIRDSGVPIQGEDGILTGLEISSLDLSGTNLVVLSACQTGLGDINDEGVFGLQRAFKKAGVGRILMTLWNVDDNATRDFMSAFYKAFSAGKTAQAALVEARNQIKNNTYKDSLGNVQSGKDPIYWAGFILLD